VVEEVFVRVGQVLHIHVRGRIIRTTSEHPFWVVNKDKWVAAGELQVGDVFLSHDGQHVEVEDLLDTGDYETVYNLRVSKYHTYFVGCEEWGFSVWAHNRPCSWGDDTAELQRLARRYVESTDPLPNSTRRRRVDWEYVFGPEHANKVPAQQRVDEHAVRDYVRSTGGSGPSTNGGNRGSNPDTLRTVGSIDDYYRGRGLDPLQEQDFHHLPGRLSEATHRTADRVVIEANGVVRIIQVVETQPGGNLAPREFAPAGDILASRQVANWRRQGYDVQFEMMLRGGNYHPLTVLNESTVRRQLT